MVGDSHPHGHAEDGPFRDHAAWLEVVAVLDWLPMPSLVLTSDGTALGANEAWAALSAASAEAARGDGWLGVVDPLYRGPLRARLRDAAVAGEGGYADVPLAGPSGDRLSRWWWRPGPAGRLLACVAYVDESQPGDGDPRRDDDSPRGRLVRRGELVTLTGRALRRGCAHGTHVAVVAVNLDGTAAAPGARDRPDGDAVVRALAERILAAVDPADVAARVGHDEIAVLCADLHSPGDGRVAADRVRDVVGQPLDVGRARVSVRATTGLVTVSPPGETAEALIARACLAARSAWRDQPAGPAAPARVTGPGGGPHVDHGGGDRTPGLRIAGPAVAGGAGADLAGMVVHRLFGVGLTLESASGLADGPVAGRLRQAVDELDAIIADVRRAAFESRPPGHRR